jgi:O-antigen ligase
MSTALPPVRRRDGSARDWLARLLGLAFVVAGGILMGMQYMAPDKRVLAVAGAAIVFGIAWRLDMLSGLGLLIIALPYPRGTIFGTTDLALILLLLVIWLLRVAQRQSAPIRGTPVDAPIAGLIGAYVLSFYNISDTVSLGFALQNAEMFLACVLVYYLIVSNVRTEADLQRIHLFQVISLSSIMLFALYELNHPGGTLIPGWIDFKQTVGTEFNTRNVRVGGPFYDFELMSEFSALSLLLVAYRIVRTTAFYPRLALSILLVLNFFILFATVTRGAIFSAAIGLAYLLFLLRRRVRFVPLTIAVASIAAAFFAMNFYVSHFTRSGDLVARLGETHFVGLVPDSRVGAWQDGWQRFLEHPLIGHGPYYSSITGTHVWFWPHNVYLLIANYVGVVGLGCYLWLLFRLLVLTRPPTDDLRGSSYSRGFILIAHVQLFIFLIDQVKIDYIRNPIYQFEVWVMFAITSAAYLISRGEAPDARTGRA